VKLITYFHLKPRLRLSESVILYTTHHTLSWRRQGQLYLYTVHSNDTGSVKPSESGLFICLAAEYNVQYFVSACVATALLYSLVQKEWCHYCE
jgi:hypothetical protein